MCRCARSHTHTHYPCRVSRTLDSALLSSSRTFFRLFLNRMLSIGRAVGFAERQTVMWTRAFAPACVCLSRIECSGIGMFIRWRSEEPSCASKAIKKKKKLTARDIDYRARTHARAHNRSLWLFRSTSSTLAVNRTVTMNRRTKNACGTEQEGECERDRSIGQCTRIRMCRTDRFSTHLIHSFRLHTRPAHATVLCAHVEIPFSPFRFSRGLPRCRCVPSRAKAHNTFKKKKKNVSPSVIMNFIFAVRTRIPLRCALLFTSAHQTHSKSSPHSFSFCPSRFDWATRSLSSLCHIRRSISSPLDYCVVVVVVKRYIVVVHIFTAL